MKNYAKFAALFLVLMTLVILVACGGGNTEAPTDLATAPATAAMYKGVTANVSCPIPKEASAASSENDVSPVDSAVGISSGSFSPKPKRRDSFCMFSSLR